MAAKWKIDIISGDTIRIPNVVEKEYNLELATSMVHQFMPEFSSQKNAIILCDSGYTKQNFVSILSSKVSVEQAQRVSLSTPV